DNNPLAIRGVMTINGSGTVTSGTIFDVVGNSAPLTGGSTSITTTGIVSGTITSESGFLTVTELKLDGDKTIAAGVGVDDEGFLYFITMIKQIGSFVQSDLAGTWQFYWYSDLIISNAPVTARGQVTFNPAGTVIGGTLTLSNGLIVTLTGG